MRVVAAARRTVGWAAVAALCLTATTELVTPTPAAAGTAAATGSAYQQVLHVYERAGSIPPCQFSAAQLQSALDGIDTYGAQYFADFTQAIDTALTARAGGECSATITSRPAAGGGGAGRTSSPDDAVARLPSVTAATSADVPAPLIVLAVLAAGLTTAAAIAAGRRAIGARRQRRRDITEPPSP